MRCPLIFRIDSEPYSANFPCNCQGSFACSVQEVRTQPGPLYLEGYRKPAKAEHRNVVSAKRSGYF